MPKSAWIILITATVAALVSALIFKEQLWLLAITTALIIAVAIGAASWVRSRQKQTTADEYELSYDSQTTRRLATGRPVHVTRIVHTGMKLAMAIVIVGGGIYLISNIPNLSLGNSTSVQPVVVTIDRANRTNVMETYTMTLGVHVKGSSTTAWIFTTDKYFFAEGIAVAGFNFAQTSEELIPNGTKVTVKLPYPQLLHSYVNQQNSGYIDGPGLFPLSSEQYLAMSQEAEDTIRKTALEQGILANAAEWGATIEELEMRRLGFKEVNIVMAPAPTPAPVPTAILP